MSKATKIKIEKKVIIELDKNDLLVFLIVTRKVDSGPRKKLVSLKLVT